MWLGRYGGQQWDTLERVPTKTLLRRARALEMLLDEEAAPLSPTGRT